MPISPEANPLTAVHCDSLDCVINEAFLNLERIESLQRAGINLDTELAQQRMWMETAKRLLLEYDTRKK